MKRPFPQALLLASAVLFCVLPGVGDAQPHDLDTPVDSPLWWTLTDDLTPAELKRLYSDRSLSLKRYDEALAAGLTHRLPEQGDRSRECLRFYVNPELTPELEPMWLAFRTFYTFYIPGEHASETRVEEAPRELREELGLSPSGVETILRAAATTAAKVDLLMADLGPKTDALSLLLIELRDDPRSSEAALDRLYDAVLARDYETVASALGKPEAEIRDLVDAHADWNRPYALVAEQLPGLKADLSEGDWQGFRRYLLTTLVPRKGSTVHFDGPCGFPGR